MALWTERLSATQPTPNRIEAVKAPRGGGGIGPRESCPSLELPWQTVRRAPLGRSGAPDPQPCHQSFTKKPDKSVRLSVSKALTVSSAESVANTAPVGESRRRCAPSR